MSAPPIPPEDTMSDDPLDPSVPPAPRDVTDAWSELDVVDTSAYDEAFFDALASDIEARVDAATVTPLRRRALATLAAIAAAIVFAVLLRPDPAPSELAEAETPDEATTLEALARAIGREATSDLFDPEVDSTSLFASADWTTVDEDQVPGTYASLLEQLDQLDDTDIDSLFTPL